MVCQRCHGLRWMKNPSAWWEYLCERDWTRCPECHGTGRQPAEPLELEDYPE